MSEYSKENRGTIAKNNRKEQDSHPDIAGSINVEGVEYWINGWLKEGRNGKFYSLSVKPKQERAEEILSQSGGGYRELDNDFPF